MVDSAPIQPGPLESELFRVSKRLQDCAQLDPAHVKPLEPASDFVRRIQEALRQVDNADIPATETNYGDATTAAVVSFKTSRHIFTRGTTSIDPIVGINTIRKLDELLKADDDRKRGRGGGGELGVSVTILPDTFIAGECNLAGFSAARLAHSGGVDWTRRDALKPIAQFVPVGGRRKLIVKGVGGAAIKFSIDAANIASIAEQDAGSVTILGVGDGKTTLNIAVEGQSPARVQIIARTAKSLPLDVFHLGPPKVAGAAQSFQTGLLPGLNKVYSAQTNITFTAGTTRDIPRMIMDGVPTVIDTNLPLFFSSITGPPRVDHPTFRFGDLQREVQNAGAVTVFISPNITDEENAAVIGRGGIRNKVCWFKTELNLNANALTLPAHEIGHSLGLQHVSAIKNEPFLMHPAIQVNNTIIPSETLDDLMAL